MRRSLLRVALPLLAVAVCLPVVLAQDLGPEARGNLADDDKAILKTIRGLLSVYDDSATAEASPEKRGELLSQFYLPADAYDYGDRPLYFGPLTDPVVVGPRRHLANIGMNFDRHRESGATYKVGVGDYQIRRDGALAVFIAKSFSVISAGGEEVHLPGRWTVVLERVGDRWLISHEHISFY